MEVRICVCGKSRREAVEMAKEELKELLWREVWKDCVELDGVEVSVDERGKGMYFVTATLYEDKV